MADYQIDCLLRLITSQVQERISTFFYKEYEKVLLEQKELVASASSASLSPAATSASSSPAAGPQNADTVPKPLELFQSRLTKLPHWIEANLSGVANQILGPNRSEIEKHCGYALGLHLRSLKMALYGPSALSHEPFAPKSMSVDNFIFHLLNNLSIALIAQPFLMDVNAPPKERANNVGRFHLLVRQQIRDTFNVFAVTAGLRDPSLSTPPARPAPPPLPPPPPPPIALCSANKDGVWEKVVNTIKESHTASLDHLQTVSERVISSFQETVARATTTLVTCLKENQREKFPVHPLLPSRSNSHLPPTPPPLPVSSSSPSPSPSISVPSSSSSPSSSLVKREKGKAEQELAKVQSASEDRKANLDADLDLDLDLGQNVGLDEGDEEARIIRHISQQGGFTHPTEEREQD